MRTKRTKSNETCCQLNTGAFRMEKKKANSICVVQIQYCFHQPCNPMLKMVIAFIYHYQPWTKMKMSYYTLTKVWENAQLNMTRHVVKVSKSYMLVFNTHTATIKVMRGTKCWLTCFTVQRQKFTRSTRLKPALSQHVGMWMAPRRPRCRKFCHQAHNKMHITPMLHTCCRRTARAGTFCRNPWFIALGAEG